MKKLIGWLLALVIAFGTIGASSAYAASTKGSFSGSIKSPSVSQFSSGSKTYSSGKRSPSGNVTQSPNTQNPYSYSQPQPRSSFFGSGIGHFLGGMAAGALVSSLFSHMLHPFGGFGHGFSLWGLLFDALIAFVLYKLIRRFVWR
ncbi:hypothetical protein [Collibacillus ludicampi]|jgi:hypothetical protein|uniref:hypothetical protein n=1 Tax=Collibacillus ludicampi TaxID=2771369 RepID=UPI0024947C47|nr:hypothetical protein [Collibacillus ludicampi]